MGYREWKQWVGSLPWSLRWFVFLILFRPLIDNFYYLKEISPFLSPLYIIGVLIPLLIIGSFFASSLPPRKASFLDLLFGLWGVLLFFNAFAILTVKLSLLTLEITLKLVTPVLLYFFARHLVRSKRDLKGVLTTFLYSAIFPLAMMLYENMFSAIGIQMSRNLVRFQGGYGDMMNYAIYINGGILAAGYFFMERSARQSVLKALLQLGVVAALCMVGLLSIHHGASWAVFGAVGVLLILHNARGKQVPALIFILLLGAGGYYVFEEQVSESITTIVSVDIKVLEGEKDEDRALHGRVGRWKRYMVTWKEMPPVPQILGVGLNAVLPLGMFTTATHNDYLRILFTTGILGFLLYMLIYIYLSSKSFGRQSSEMFLLQGILVIFILYSITTTPTLYGSLVYLGFSVFAYAALPRPTRQRLPLSRVRRPGGPSRVTRPAP